MTPLIQIATSLTAVGIIGGGALTLDRMHVASEDFRQYIEIQQESEERNYVLRLKKDIRDIKMAIAANPDEVYLHSALADALDDLCELRPEDKLCEEQ